MKLIKLAAAALITMSSLTAQAGLLTISAPAPVSVEVSSINNFKANLPTGAEYTIGGNLASAVNGPMHLAFDFLGKEAGYYNIFKSVLGSTTYSIDTTMPSPSFSYSDNFSIGELLNFSFATGGWNVSPNTVTNGFNTIADGVVSFAIALDTTFDGVFYDAILFFDDTGARDDDNHDDLVIGIRATVPESSTFVLMLMGLVGLFAARRLKA